MSTATDRKELTSLRPHTIIESHPTQTLDHRMKQLTNYNQVSTEGTHLVKKHHRNDFIHTRIQTFLTEHEWIWPAVSEMCVWLYSHIQSDTFRWHVTLVSVLRCHPDPCVSAWIWINSHTLRLWVQNIPSAAFNTRQINSPSYEPLNDI